jgi:hypothetical protein
MTGAQTDKSEGLQRLRLTADKGRYLAPFARLLLAVAALRDKDSTDRANAAGWTGERVPGQSALRDGISADPGIAPAPDDPPDTQNSPGFSDSLIPPLTFPTCQPPTSLEDLPRTAVPL